MARLMVFVDGENLTLRFQEMVKEGRNARTETSPNLWEHLFAVDHIQDKFAWSPGTVRGLFGDEELLRAQYYAMCESGGDDAERLSEHIAAQNAIMFYAGTRSTVRLMPRVFQKTKKNTKTKSVDINVCVDVLDYVERDALDTVFLVTGDIDYLPLLEAVMRAGKRVIVGALSSGVAPRLRHATDRFVDLDPVYFIS